MKTGLLANAIGRSLAKLDHLNGAYLPPDVDQSDAVAIVRSANEHRGLPTPPFALLVEQTPTTLDDESLITVVTPDRAVAYREGDRILVFHGHSTGLVSLEKAFKPRITRSFPVEEPDTLTLHNVARSAIHECLTAAGITIAEDKLERATFDRMTDALQTLRDMHESIGSSGRSWNSQWFTHVDHGLALLADALERSDRKRSVSSLLEELTYASFSLPKPTSGLFQNRRRAKDLSRAFNEWWRDAETLENTVAILANHQETQGPHHALAKIDWRKLDGTSTRHDSPLTGFAVHEHTAAGRIEAFASLTEQQFVQPVHIENAKKLALFDASGNDLSLTSIGDPDLHVLSSRMAEHDGTQYIESQYVYVNVPTLDTVTHAPPVAQVGLDISVRNTSFKADMPQADGSPHLKIPGVVSIKTRAGEFEYQTRKRTLAVASLSGGFESLIHPSAQTGFILLPPSPAGAILFPQMRGKLGPPVVVAPTTFDSRGIPREGDDWARVGLKPGTDYRLLAWAKETIPRLNGNQLDPIFPESNIYVLEERFSPTGNDRLEVDGTEIDLILEASADDRPFSPLLAAALDVTTSTEQPSEDLKDSLLGSLEAELTRLVNPDRKLWRRSIGHLLLPEDRSSPVGPLVELDGGSTLGASVLVADWEQLGNLHIPEKLVDSTEAERLRVAFEQLNVGKKLLMQDGDSTYLTWPSRVSWANIWQDREALEEYLAAYVALIHKARSVGDARGVFWATYPFSVVIRRTRPAPASCKAVMLSPLHPVRLTWLAATEVLLREASNSKQLAGIIEGWNLPMIGPNDSAAGRLLAIPVDNGAGQVFLGWSMMVKAEVDDSAQLSSPRMISGKPAPGSAASGLNAAGVTSAIRDYRNLNPHVSTLTIDLAATTPAPRLAEIDHAVLREARAWASENTDSLAGGFRVLDSLNREGHPPRQELSSPRSSVLETPLTWSRYRDDSIETNFERNVNLRILQDSGLALQVTTSDGEGTGVMAETPVRRFSVPSGALGPSATAHIEPTLAPKVGWAPLASALAAIESQKNSTPSIESQLVGGALGRDDAEWTISGEAMVNPASLAKLLKDSHHSNTMLWEWRPPFLAPREVDGEPLLEQRPYISVGRIPMSFKTQLEERLNELERHGSKTEAVNALLSTLGERGIGLSSLLTTSDTHSAGALGFATTMRMLSTTSPQGRDRLVIPIDLCDKFLTALAGGRDSENHRRADLMVLDLSDDSLVLVGIEIKFYGLVTPHASLPTPGSSTLRDGLEQLRSTEDLLTDVENRYREASDADRTLMAHALATLVETGIRLRPYDVANRARTVRRLTNLVNGNSSVVAGRPVLTFFMNGATTSDGKSFISYREAATQSWRRGHIQFITEPGAVLDELDSEPSEILAAWESVMDWASSDLEPSEPAQSDVSTRLPDVDLPEQQCRATEPDTTGLDLAVMAAESSEPPGNDNFRLKPPASNSADARTPMSGEGIHFPVGQLQDAIGPDSEADFWPSNTNLNQLNLGVVGDLGTGKTQLLQTLIYNLRTLAPTQQGSPISFLVLDYKRDFQDPSFLEAVGGRVLKPRNIPLNVLGFEGEFNQPDAYRKSKTFVDTISKIYSGVGPVQRNRLLQSLLELYKNPDGDDPTLANLLKLYLSDANDRADAVVSVLNEFVLGEVFRPGNDLTSFDDLMNDTVLVVDLHGLGADQRLKNALVALFLNLYYEYVQGLKKWPYAQGSNGTQLRRLNSFLLVDEATNIMKYRFDVLEQLLLQGREFGVGVMLASQYLSHFHVTGTNYGEVLRTWFIHKVPNVSLKELTQLGLPDATESDVNRIKQLGVHEAYYSSFGFDGRFMRGIPYYQLAESEKSID